MICYAVGCKVRARDAHKGENTKQSSSVDDE